MPSLRSIAIVANPDKFQSRDELKALKLWFEKRHVRTMAPHQLSSADMIVTLGGDGTILSVAQKAALAGIPVVAVNVGRLGFMTTTGRDDMYSVFEDVLENRAIISERLMLDVTVPRSKGPHLALNDAVIRIGSATRMTMMNAMIENEDLGTFTGDGLIVSTPTGSTAYSLAAQGPIVHPEMEALVLTPICAHSFTQRPVVFSSRLSITIWPKDRRGMNELQLCLDGQRVFKLQKDDKIVVRRSKHKLKIVQKRNTSYFEILKEKLLWGGL